MVISGIVVLAGPHVHYVMVTSLMAAKGCSVIFVRPGTTHYVAVLMKKCMRISRTQSTAGCVHIVSFLDMKTTFSLMMT